MPSQKAQRFLDHTGRGDLGGMRPDPGAQGPATAHGMKEEGLLLLRSVRGGGTQRDSVPGPTYTQITNDHIWGSYKSFF